MADKETEQTQDTPKKSSMKVIIMVAAAMFIEAGVIIGAAFFTRTPEVSAAPFAEAAEADPDRVIEIPLLKERMSNNRQGIVYLYETEIVIQIREKYEKDVTRRLEENSARIKMMIGTLWRQAEPRFFEEPQLSTLTRQVESTLGEIIGTDPTSGESCLEGVLIPVLRGFPANF